MNSRICFNVPAFCYSGPVLVVAVPGSVAVVDVAFVGEPDAVVAAEAPAVDAVAVEEPVADAVVAAVPAVDAVVVFVAGEPLVVVFVVDDRLAVVFVVAEGQTVVAGSVVVGLPVVVSVVDD